MDTELIQNPNSPAPKDILNALTGLTVKHVDFAVKIKIGQILIHQLLADDAQDFFALAYEMAFPIQQVIPIHKAPFYWNDERSIELNNSSGFNYRNIIASTKLSKHAIGCAFDINPQQNIYIKYEAGKESFRIPKQAKYEENTPGTLTNSHPLVLLMKKRGWTWGGDWTPDSGRIDYQHFEKVPAELKQYVE